MTTFKLVETLLWLLTLGWLSYPYAVVEVSPSTVYGARLLSGFGT